MIAGRPGKSRSLICFVDRRRGREEEDGNGWLAADQLAACLPFSFSFSFSGRQGRGRARTPEAPPPSHSLEQRGTQPSPAQLLLMESPPRPMSRPPGGGSPLPSSSPRTSPAAAFPHRGHHPPRSGPWALARLLHEVRTFPTSLPPHWRHCDCD